MTHENSRICNNTNLIRDALSSEYSHSNTVEQFAYISSEGLKKADPLRPINSISGRGSNVLTGHQKICKCLVDKVAHIIINFCDKFCQSLNRKELSQVVDYNTKLNMFEGSFMFILILFANIQTREYSILRSLVECLQHL